MMLCHGQMVCIRSFEGGSRADVLDVGRYLEGLIGVGAGARGLQIGWVTYHCLGGDRGKNSETVELLV